MEQIRSFIAIELPDDLKAGLTELQSRLGKGRESFVKWVDPYSIHLTLKFLGYVSVSSIEEITLAMEESVQGISPFRLETRGLGVFPNPNRVQVVWVGLDGDLNTLKLLQKRVEENVEQLGFPRETRAFTPHLTLARVREGAFPEQRQKLGQRVTAAQFETVYNIAVESINLMKSQLTPAGAIYSRLASVELKKT